MSSMWNNGIQISVFGESHSAGIGVVLDHLPAGKKIDLSQVRAFLRRRQAKSDGTTTSRIEPDLPKIISGLYDDKTTGTPLAMVIENTNTRSQDYKNLKASMRPGHADYTGYLRYHGQNDIRGGGHFSGRLTACLVMAGAVCGQILEEKGIYTGAHLLSVGALKGQKIDTVALTKEEVLSLRQLPFPVKDPQLRTEIIKKINDVRMSQNSIGGMIECVCVGMPAGVGSPMLNSLESILASLIFSIPGVKGLEFGKGFEVASMLGSDNNDPFYYDEDQKVKTQTNHHGGILGGISSGMPIDFRVAMKPTPSISLTQDTIDVEQQKNTTLNIVGRHDPCIAVRAVPVVEACCNIGLLSAMVDQFGVEL